MRILQVFDFLSLPYGGGTVDVVFKLSQALGKRGHAVTVCIGDYKLDRKYLSSLDAVNARILRSLFNRYGFYIMPSLVKLDVKDFDIVHLHCYRSFQNVVICCKARKHNVPYIIDAHGSTVELPEAKQLIRRLYDKAFGYETLKYASRFIAETEVGIAEYKKLGASSDKSVLLHPLLDVEEFASLPPNGLFRKKYNINRPFVLFVGRINWAKGIAVLLEAVYRLDDIFMVIMGQDDGFKPFLDKMITERDMSNRVLFTGFLDGQDKLSVLVDADVLIQPSRNEAGARPSLEAILCDTPVIVTRNTGAGKEIEKFDGGYLVDYGDIVGLRNTIKYILGHHREVVEKTLQAKEYIKDKLSLDKQVVQYEELYSEVLS